MVSRCCRPTPGDSCSSSPRRLPIRGDWPGSCAIGLLRPSRFNTPGSASRLSRRGRSGRAVRAAGCRFGRRSRSINRAGVAEGGAARRAEQAVDRVQQGRDEARSPRSSATAGNSRCRRRRDEAGLGHVGRPHLQRNLDLARCHEYGLASSSSATPPLTTAVAMLVPVRRRYAFFPVPAMCHDG